MKLLIMKHTWHMAQLIINVPQMLLLMTIVIFSVWIKYHTKKSWLIVLFAKKLKKYFDLWGTIENVGMSKTPTTEKCCVWKGERQVGRNLHYALFFPFPFSFFFFFFFLFPPLDFSDLRISSWTNKTHKQFHMTCLEHVLNKSTL